MSSTNCPSVRQLFEHLSLLCFLLFDLLKISVIAVSNKIKEKGRNGCWGKNIKTEDLGRREEGGKPFSPFSFSPLPHFFPSNPHNRRKLQWFYKTCRLAKNSLEWRKNSSFKVENLKFSCFPHEASTMARELLCGWGKGFQA